jgi:hypothetical protein
MNSNSDRVRSFPKAPTKHIFEQPLHSPVHYVLSSLEGSSKFHSSSYHQRAERRRLPHPKQRKEQLAKMAFQSPLFRPLNAPGSSSSSSSKLSNGTATAYPIRAPVEIGTKAPTGVDLYARFALAGAIGVSSRFLLCRQTCDGAREYFTKWCGSRTTSDRSGHRPHANHFWNKHILTQLFLFSAPSHMVLSHPSMSSRPVFNLTPRSTTGLVKRIHSPFGDTQLKFSNYRA